MRKRNLIFPLVVSSLFMPSIEALERTTDLNSLESENNIYEEVDILIAEGGSGKKSKEQQENLEKNKEKAKEAAKKRINSKIKEFGGKARKIDPKASFEEWADQLIEIKDNIAALEQFLNDIQVFIDYSIKKHAEISEETPYSTEGQYIVIEYLKEFNKISRKAKKLGLATNVDIKNLLKSLDSGFAEFINGGWIY